MKIKKSELAKLRKEVNEEFKPLNTTEEIIAWYKDLIKKQFPRFKEPDINSKDIVLVYLSS